MWRGEPYGEFEQAGFAAGERTALEELRLAAIEDRLQAELAVGAGAKLIGEIEGRLSRHPLRERLWAQLRPRRTDGYGALRRRIHAERSGR